MKSPNKCSLIKHSVAALLLTLNGESSFWIKTISSLVCYDAKNKRKKDYKEHSLTAHKPGDCGNSEDKMSATKSCFVSW